MAHTGSPDEQGVSQRGELLRSSAKASQSGTEMLITGLGIGAMGLAGAALGAVCPLCVVATPTLLSLGVGQKLRAKWLERKAARPADPPSTGPVPPEVALPK
jgi:hypothetical protein